MKDQVFQRFVDLISKCKLEEVKFDVNWQELTIEERKALVKAFVSNQSIINVESCCQDSEFNEIFIAAQANEWI